jgi:hypothetical protein
MDTLRNREFELSEEHANFMAGESDNEMPCDQQETTQDQRGHHGLINVAEMFTKRKPTTDITDFHSYFKNLAAVIMESIRENDENLQASVQANTAEMKAEHKAFRSSTANINDRIVVNNVKVQENFAVINDSIHACIADFKEGIKAVKT